AEAPPALQPVSFIEFEITPAKHPLGIPAMQLPYIGHCSLPLPTVYFANRKLTYSQSALLEASFLAAGGAVQGHQAVGTLRNSLLPEQREWAAQNLARINAESHPEVVQALVYTALGDPVATVRLACSRGLSQINVSTVPVVTVMQVLQSDVDVQV